MKETNFPRPNRFYVGRPQCGVKQDLSLYFADEEGKTVSRILDSEGIFVTFPGVEETEELKRELDGFRIVPELPYELYVKARRDGGWRIYWTVRPDGRYWMDSWGFGAEDYESLLLYSYIDSDGKFMMPFKLYSIGYSVYGEHRLKGD